jgi:hypothetical protein
MAEYPIRTIIVRGIKATLTASLDTSVADLKVKSIVISDAVKYDATKKGGLHCYITMMDQEQDISKKTDDGKMTVKPHLIDGGIRSGFSVQPVKVGLLMVFSIKDETLAWEQAEIVFARTRDGLRKMDLPTHPDTNQPVDDWGNGIAVMEMAPANLSQEGSSQGTYVFRGEFLLKFFTFVGG